MRYGQESHRHMPRAQAVVINVQPVLLLRLCRIRPWIMHIHVHAVVAQFRDHIDTRVLRSQGSFL